MRLMEENIDYQIGDIKEGVITGLQSYGAFVSFPNGQSGLIHISEISSKFVRSISDYVQVGKSVRVKILAIDENTQHLRLSLKQTVERERQAIRRPPYLKRRKIVPDEQKDFQILQEHLEQWIEEAWAREDKDHD